MSPANHYKQIENRVVDSAGRGFGRFWSSFTGFFRNIFQMGRQRFTVMFIPHSERKVFNFRISVFAMGFFTFLTLVLIGAFFLFGTKFAGMSRMLAQKEQELQQAQASLESVRDEISDLVKNSRTFENSLEDAKSQLGLGSDTAGNVTNVGGDFTSFYNMQEQNDGMLRELSELKNLSSFLNDSVGSLNEISGVLQSQGDLLVELPTLWPVQGGVGRVTMRFGPNEHPMTKQWYLHKGFDIAYRRGKPIVATANGKVIEYTYEKNGYGKFVVIKHDYGFTTKYAHMDNVFVNEGDTVAQGQVIGVMGNTGLSTGTHVHYEIMIGSQVVDPERFLYVQNRSK